jgi:hypothetical protein
MTALGTYSRVKNLSTGSPVFGLATNFVTARPAYAAESRAASPRLFPARAWSWRSGPSS